MKTSLRWIVFDLVGVDDEVAIGRVAAALLYAHEGSHTVMLSGEEMDLEEGQASFVEGDELGVVGAKGLWLSLLTGADAEIPAELGGADIVAKSDFGFARRGACWRLRTFSVLTLKPRREIDSCSSRTSTVA